MTITAGGRPAISPGPIRCTAFRYPVTSVRLSPGRDRRSSNAPAASREEMSGVDAHWFLRPRAAMNIDEPRPGCGLPRRHPPTGFWAVRPHSFRQAAEDYPLVR